MSDAQLARTGLVRPDVFEASLVVGADAAGLGDTDIHDAHDAAKPHGTHPAWVGKVLSHFRLLRPLGEGAMGLVIQAEDTHLGRLVALKVLRKRIEGVDETRRVDQFLREARAAGRLDHPNVARVYEINEHKGWWYIATELLEGGTLFEVVHAAGPLSPTRACPIIADAAAGLAAAHQAGMVHRDVKPSNLMLTRTGRCKLVDFGLVRMDDPDDPFDFTEQAVGTPHYMAPEIIRRQAPTPLADVYSLAAVLYFALTGEPPFTGKTIPDVLRQHIKASRPDVRVKNPACPESLARLVQKAMAVEPAERPNAATFALALRAESIGADAHQDPLLLDAASSSVLADALAHSGAKTTLLSESPSRSGIAMDRSSALIAAANRAWDWLPRIAALVLLLVLMGAGVWLVVQRMNRSDAPPPAVADRQTFARQFPDAPESYGLADPGYVPESAMYFDRPVATWVGHVAVEPSTYVASRSGRRYYRPSDPQAALISPDQLITYPTDQAAQADGRSPGW